MQFQERYSKLNKPQKKAVDTIEGPLLVVAGPGSGKTEILSLRVAKILKETQTLPSNILCLTFTESAEVNMRERLAKLIGHEAYRVSIHTFHNFSVNIIQKYPEFFYKGAIFSAADPISQISILEEIFEGLPHDHVFRSFHPDKGFVYLSDISKCITNLKRSGIIPVELEAILKENKKSFEVINEKLIPIFEKKVSKSILEEIKVALKSLPATKRDGKMKNIFPPLVEAVHASLEETIKLCEEKDKNEPLSKWKAKYIKNTDEGKKVFRDELNIEKMDAVLEIYTKYREQMHKRSLYDFDDMILDVIEAIEKHPRLKYDLQEQYQYILVDEFQDTNNAQMRIVTLLADAEVNEGRPNIMVVGDDDQAVYKFQGAELSNILNFRTLFKDVETVTMVDNYRSTQEILDVATHVIRKGENRLENLISEIDKTLISSNPELNSKLNPKLSNEVQKDTNFKGIVTKEFDTSLHEYHFVSREIKKLIDAGTSPESIAVIARKHWQLEALVPYLKGARVPIKYEREQNVFLEPHIEQLILIARFITTLSNTDKSEADEFLPRILSFPFWAIPRHVIWRISQKAHKEGRLWLECMLDSDIEEIEPIIPKIANFLINLGTRSADEPLEKILDDMVGAHVQLVDDSEDSEDSESEGFSEKESKSEGTLTTTQKNKNSKNTDASEKEFYSPFKEYYFNKKKFEHARAEYLSFLSSLRVFVKALREYKGRAGTADILLMNDLVDFVDIHQKNNIPLNDQSPFVNARNAVNLLSAHKAKGLEFDTVFVLSCQDDIWAGRGMIKKISMPINLPIDPAGDTEDDQLRLFYVALTRAKKNLYITSYKVDDDGSSSEKLRFLVPPENADELLGAGSGDNAGDKNNALKKIYQPVSSTVNEGEVVPDTSELLTASWLLYHTPPFLDEENELLKSLLNEYKLSITHLNNFLNVTKGGPQLFLEHNLLRFPQAKTPSGSYGSAIHRALERLSIQLRAGNSTDGASTNDTKSTASSIYSSVTGTTIVSEDELIDWYKQYLKMERLSRDDFKLFSEKGEKALRNFYRKKKDTFKSTDKTEVNFAKQGVILGEKSFVKNEKQETGGEIVGTAQAHITGKIDRMVDVGGNRFEVHDYKTGKAKTTWQGKDEYEKIKLYENEKQLVFYKLLVENSKDFAGKYKVDTGVLEFVESLGDKGELADLSLKITSEKVEYLEKLAIAVYQKIINLDFPDVSKYPQTVEGIKEFEADLLKGSI